MPHTELSELQLRVVAALQLNGRASWSRIAGVLGVPERTVTRHGAELLSSGRVTVAALARPERQLILAGECYPGTARLVSDSLARRDDSIFSYQTTGDFDVVAEIAYQEDLSELLGVHLPAIPGIRKITAFPALKYFKTVQAWRTGALSEAEAAALHVPTQGTIQPQPATTQPGPNDAALIALLKRDGRRSLESIARRLKMSETSVARRIEWLLSSGQLSIRAIVEPADVGFPVEAMLWVRVPPQHVEQLGRQLQQASEVRYAAAIAGEYQLAINVTVRSHAELYRWLSHPIWGKLATHVRTDLIYEARKRGGRIRPTG